MGSSVHSRHCQNNRDVNNVHKLNLPQHLLHHISLENYFLIVGFADASWAGYSHFVTLPIIIYLITTRIVNITIWWMHLVMVILLIHSCIDFNVLHSCTICVAVIRCSYMTCVIIIDGIGISIDIIWCVIIVSIAGIVWCGIIVSIGIMRLQLQVVRIIDNIVSMVIVCTIRYHPCDVSILINVIVLIPKDETLHTLFYLNMIGESTACLCWHFLWSWHHARNSATPYPYLDYSKKYNPAGYWTDQVLRLWFFSCSWCLLFPWTSVCNLHR